MPGKTEKRGWFDSDGFYAALDAVRRARDLNWKQVAAGSGVSASTLTRMAQGKRPDVDGLAALVAWSGLDADDYVRSPSPHAVGSTVAVMSDRREPVPFEVYQPGVYLHGTKADLAVGELLVAGRESNFEEGRMMNYVYFTATLDAATWGAELAFGESPGRIYLVEPTGQFEDDPNLTDKKFAGNPTQSFRSREPLRVVGELVDWIGHSSEKLSAMRAGLQRVGTGEIED